MQPATVRTESIKARRVVHEIADFARLALGLGFVAAAVVNAVLTVQEFTRYRAFADHAWLPGYESAWRDLAVPALPALLLLVVVSRRSSACSSSRVDEMRDSASSPRPPSSRP